METPLFTLVDLKPRGGLNEGRNYGIGFGFAQRKDFTLTTVGPLSCCREYLNDQIYSETTGLPNDAHGYRSKREGLLDDESLYIIIGILNMFTRHRFPEDKFETYQGQAKDTKFLEEHRDELVKFMHQIEDYLKVPDRTNIVPLVDGKGAVIKNRYAMVIPKFWGSTTYFISMYTMFFRTALEEQYKEGDALAFLKKSQGYDALRTPLALQRLELFRQGKHLVQKWDKVKNDYMLRYTIHSCGIVDATLS